MTTTIVTENRSEVTPAAQSQRVHHLHQLRLLQAPPFTCAVCEDKAGYLYDGLCLGCQLDAEEAAIEKYEASERNDYFPPAGGKVLSLTGAEVTPAPLPPPRGDPGLATYSGPFENALDNARARKYAEAAATACI